MFTCKNLYVPAPNSVFNIISDASVEFKDGEMNAVIGPSGCGKTTLIKAMLGIIPSKGNICLNGKQISKSEDLIGQVGFAPQFTCAYPMLTVEESIQSALDIAVADSRIKESRLEHILSVIGLSGHRTKFVSSLSGGQLRRLGLGIELANAPQIMCCDEVTSGLDPLSENEILDLLYELCKTEGKTFICIIHNLAKLNYFKNITVIFEGKIVFSGDLPTLLSYFEIDNALLLYDKLNEYEISYWIEKYVNYKSGSNESLEETPSETHNTTRPPLISQFLFLIARRYKLFFRDTTYLALTMLITFGFPLIVVIFAIGGLPQIETLSLERNLGAIEEIKRALEVQLTTANTSSLVTGLILFQVILLALMGANTSAREIASERNLYEKERLIGLKPTAYILSKITFVSSIAIIQGIWMCGFVKLVCKFPGSFIEQASILALACLAITLICLAFSAIISSPDKANTLSIYLVGFQLPLSGIVLALPVLLKWCCRPFIAIYWGWAGYMVAMKDSPIYDAYMQTTQSTTYIPSLETCAIALIGQAICAVVIVVWGCKRKIWN